MATAGICGLYLIKDGPSPSGALTWSSVLSGSGNGGDRRGVQFMNLASLALFIAIMATAILGAWQFAAIGAVLVLAWLATRWNRRRSTRS
jgi:hypothetical protein